jgi:Zn-dependent protease
MMRFAEIRDLLVSALALAVAFGIALSGGYRGFANPQSVGILTLLSFFAISLGFVLHELAHRLVARKFGCVAIFKMWPLGLLAALGCSLFGFVFAAPGAVNIYSGKDEAGNNTLTLERSGLISLAGPVMNIGLTIIFMALNIAIPTLLFSIGAQINAWLAMFNLIAFGPLDGAKIFVWSKKIWIAAFATAIALFALQFFIFR